MSDTWVFRGAAVAKDPDVAHVVQGSLCLAGPEPCESCGSILAWYRRAGRVDGPGEQYRIKHTNHGSQPGTSTPHSMCAMTCTLHTVDDCRNVREGRVTFSATFVRGAA